MISRASILLCLVLPALVAARIVVFNTESLKYHGPSCRWAKKCTVNCIEVPEKDAKKQGGVPCKVCGGR